MNEDYVRTLLTRVVHFKITQEQLFGLLDKIAPIVEIEYKAGRTTVVPSRTGFSANVDHMQELYYHFSSAGLRAEDVFEMFDLLEPIAEAELADHTSNVNISPVTSEELIAIVNSVPQQSL